MIAYGGSLSESGDITNCITSSARADAIMVLCSHDTIVAERGAGLFLEGWAPLLDLLWGPGSDYEAPVGRRGGGSIRPYCPGYGGAGREHFDREQVHQHG